MINLPVVVTKEASTGNVRLRVLVADREPVRLHLIRGLLNSGGYDVIPASDGLQAWKALDADPSLRLAILCAELPGIDGLEICRRLRQHARSYVYVVLLSTPSSPHSSLECLDAGADDHLIIPFDKGELRARLQTGARVIAERSFRESEERFQGAFEYAGVASVLTDLNGRLLQVNQALCRLLSFSEEELLGLELGSLVPEGDRSALSRLQFDVLQGIQSDEETVQRFVCKDGSLIWGSITLAVLHDADRHPTCILVQVQNISRRRSAEEALARSEALFRGIMECAPDLIAVINQNGQFVYASPSHATILGFTPKELLEENALACVHPDDAAELARHNERLRDSSEGETLLARIQRKDGRWLHFENHSSLLRRGPDDAYEILVISRCIEERLRAEAEIKAAHAETEAFLQAIPSVLIGLDAQARITRWNPMAERVFGPAADTVLGCKFDECGIAWRYLDMAAQVQRWLQAPGTCSYDDLTFERDGKVRFVGLALRPIRFEHTGNEGFIITGADITARKYLEEQLRQSQKLEAVGQLAAGIAHEINTPTQYVGDNTRFLKDSWTAIAHLLTVCRDLGTEARGGALAAASLRGFEEACEKADIDYLLAEIPSAIDQALEGLDRVSRIVRAMKEFSHPGAQEKRPVDINRAIETTVTVARNEWKYVAEVVTELDPSLPLVPCLAGELNQVMLNLIINAAQAIAAGTPASASPKGTITISTERRQDGVQIAIRDTGMGIPEAIRQRVFEPFFTTKPVGQGTGQGLALAHAVVVKRHQGRIWFESTVGEGTTFFVQLPLSQEAQ